MDKIYIVMNYVEHDLKSLMETMKQPFLPGEPFSRLPDARPARPVGMGGAQWDTASCLPCCDPLALFIPGEVKTLMIQLLRGVKHLHDNWILHRDLKTSNLLLSHAGILKVRTGSAVFLSVGCRQAFQGVASLWCDF